jgi:cytochrome c peroxidase
MKQKSHSSTPQSLVIYIIVWSTLLTLACDDEKPSTPPERSAIETPLTFPTLGYPADNLPTTAKIELGRYLFYDVKLSGNQSYSCGTCHQQELAFTDGRAVALGSTDEHHTLGSMSLVNIGYAATLGWGNPTLEDLEAQALIPMFGEEPIELGLGELENEEFLDRFREDERYPQLFSKAFPDEADPISVKNIARSIASFERSMISANSPFDQFQQGDEEALSASARRGMELFFSETLECFHCHGGFNFSDSVASPDFPFSEKPMHNNGMYNLDEEGRYPAHQGAYELTRVDKDRGLFKAPTLRNIEVTAPYLHDGSAATLDELIDLYAAGGRVITEGPLAGDGRAHPNKSTFIAGFDISSEEKADLIVFLYALTDDEFLNNPNLSNPF